MTHSIVFKRDVAGFNIDPLMDRIREAARSNGWTGMQGCKDWAKETYGATLKSGKWDDWTSIKFKTEQDLNRFKQDFKVELMENDFPLNNLIQKLARKSGVVQYDSDSKFESVEKFAKLMLDEIDGIIDNLYRVLPLEQASVLLTLDENIKEHFYGKEE